MDVLGAAGEDQIAEARGEAVAVEDEGVQELAVADGHEQPGAEPGRAAGGEEEFGLLEGVVAELERADEDVDGDRLA